MHDPRPPQTSESSSHRGNCHCGAVRFNFTISPPLHEYPVNNCNCSICRKNGYLLVYPNTTDFTLESGQDVLRNHKFHTGMVRHQFCGECGSSCFIVLDQPAPPFLVVNVRLSPVKRSWANLEVKVRMLEDFDQDKLVLNKVNGWAYGEEYKPSK